MIKSFKISMLIFTLAGLLSACDSPEKTDVIVWDISMPWGSKVFHTQNAINFATRIRQESKGRLVINIHPGAVLGIKGPESMRAVSEAIVDGAELAAFQQTGLEPIFALDALPFLVNSHEELALLYEDYRPLVEKKLKQRGLIPLYMVPWPNQNIYTKQPFTDMEALAGQSIRTYDAQSYAMMQRLNMVPKQITSSDVVFKLATGELDSVMTSTTTGASQKYWEFLSTITRTNHLWVSNIMVINQDRFNQLPTDLQALVTETAADMQQDFWRISKGDDLKQLSVLKENGMTVAVPSPALRQNMISATAPMIDDFIKANPDAAAVIKAFKEKRSRGLARRYNFSPKAPVTTKGGNP